MPAAPARGAGGSAQTQVIVKGHADVARGETAASVVIFDGPARIDGTVTGSVVAFHGPVTVSGTVKGSVISLSDRVVLLGGAVVEGDVRSQKTAVIAQDATVGGTIGSVEFSKFDQVARVSRYIWWFGVTVSTFLLGLVVLLLPAGVPTSIQRAATRIGPSIGWGALAFFGLPIAAVILLVIIITLPLGLALLFAMGLLYLVGYVVAAWALGGRIVHGSSRFAKFLVGWGILRGVALIPILAGVAWTIATIFGLGALALAVWSKEPAATEQPPPAVPAIPAPPPPV
jgi:hypothetical protein